MPLIPVNREANLEGVVTFTILIEGNEISGTIQVKSLTVFNAVNRLPTADIVILDGNAAEQVFEVSNDDDFVPGNKIEIKAGYNSENETIFEGVIISQKVSAYESGTQLNIRCKSAAYGMTLSRRSKIFYDVTDSDVFEEIIGDYGVRSDVESLAVQYNEVVQHRATDWDFVMSRAQINGIVGCLIDESFEIKKPDLGKDAIADLEFGNNMYDVQLEMDARNQYQDYKAKTWNYSDQELVEQDGSGSENGDAGNISASELANDNANMELVQGNAVETAFADNWINAKKMWQEMSKITGTISVQGNHIYKPTELVTIKGVSDRFNGKHFISAISHEIAEGNWKTTISVGIDPRWFTEQFENVSELPASAMIPAVSGLQVGVVTALEDDPAGEQRIQVQLPLIHQDSDGVWARVLSQYAGENFGMHFLPEIGTEVLIGFLNDDPHQAIVLGGLFSNKNVSPQEFKDDNFIKTIVTKGEIKLEIDDDKKIIKIETPNGNIITADDDEGQILLEDENGNTVTLNSDGIELNSASDINIKATGDINIEGTNISNAAQAEFKAEGSAGAEVSTSAIAVLKGSLVQIN